MARTYRFIAVLNSTCRGVLQAVREFRHGYDVVRIAAALLLLVAATSKAYQLVTEPVLGSGVLESRPFLMFVVEFELFFGLRLLSGLLPSPFGRAARRESESLPSPSGRGAGGEGFLTWLAALTLMSSDSSRQRGVNVLARLATHRGVAAGKAERTGS